MPKLLPQNLTTMPDVTRYWQQCLQELDQQVDEKQVASHMVGVTINECDEEWNKAHPAYPIIFELATELELPSEFTNLREERWQCIRALVAVLEKEYLNKR